MSRAQSPQPIDGYGYAFVGAVHQLLDSSAAASRADLILAAACHFLNGSTTLSLSDIEEKLIGVWPGSANTRDEVLEAMRLGVEVRVVTESESLDGQPSWTLTGAGAKDVQRHSAWVSATRERAVEELRAKAESGNQVVPDTATANLWLGKLVSALVIGIRGSQSVYLGSVEALVTGHVVPRRIDRNLVLNELDDVVDPSVGEFLRAAALSAIDPLDPFGNELVSHITTGCILHAFVAGRDRQTVLDRIGSPNGVRVVLDTPVLLQMVGPKRLAQPIWRSIELAVEAQWDVVVCLHSIDELVEVLERDIPGVVEQIAEAIQSGSRAELYASLVDEQLVTVFVESMKDGTYSSHHELLDTARDLDSKLTAAGVVVRPHGNENDDAFVNRCKVGLESVLTVRRSTTVIDRDANTMALAWRRRRQPRGTNRWPASWVVTFDRKMSAAYRRAQNMDEAPLTLSPTQWMTLVSFSAESASVEELAEMAASQLVDEAMWQMPSRFPADVALELAKRLSPDRGGSDTDVRVAQMSLDDLLDSAGNALSGTSLAGEVLSSRAERVNSISQRELDLAVTKAKEAQDAADAARVVAATAKADAVVAKDERDKQKARADTSERSLGWKTTQVRRVAISCLIGLIPLGVLVYFLTDKNVSMSVGAGVGLVLYLLLAITWCRKEKVNITQFIITLIVDGLSTASAVQDLWPKR